MHGAFKRLLMRGGSTGLGLVVLDPSDLTTLRVERTGASASTQAVVDGPVGSMRNLGTLGGWFIADADARRPTLRSNGTRYWLEFDGNTTAGLGDYLRLPSPNINLVTLDVFMGLRIRGWVTGQSGVLTFANVPHGNSGNDIASNQGMAIFINGNDNTIIARGGATSSMIITAAGIKPDPHVYHFRKPGNTSATLSLNNAPAVTDSSITDNFTTIGGDIYLGVRYGNGVNSPGNFELYSLVIRNQLAANPAAVLSIIEDKTFGTVPQYPAITDTTQLEAARATLISEVFSTRGGVLPTTTYTTELEGTPPLTGLTNLATCHRLVIPDYPDRPRLYTPNSPRDDKILLTCAGHDVAAGGNGLQSTAIQGALTRGIRVVTFVLPDGVNELTSGDPADHEAAQSPMSDWVGPVSIVINTLLAEFPSAEIYIAGISGGGWMATMCGACDVRIRGTYDFVGSAPDYYYLNRDWEQRLPGITATFMDLYILGACPSPRRHKHVWHGDPNGALTPSNGDPVAFNPLLYFSRPAWDAQLATQASSIGGGDYDFVWDVGNNQHALRNPFFNDQVFAEIAP